MLKKINLKIAIPFVFWILSIISFIVLLIKMQQIKDQQVYSFYALLWLGTIIIGSLFFIFFFTFLLKELNKKNKYFISKINNIVACFWFINTVIFITVIFLSTKGFTIDPCYGQGCPEHVYLLPMLLSLFAGLFFFGLTVFTGFLRVILKAKKWRPPFDIGFWKIGFATFLIVFIVLVYIFALFKGNAVRWGGSYTGEDLLNAVNVHRKSVGVSEVKLSEGLCDNLVSRWKAVKEGKQHEGFEEWIKREGIQTNYGYKEVAELYIRASTPTEAIAFWAGSPGHRIQLENLKWTDGCAYANEGYGVVVMGVK